MDTPRPPVDTAQRRTPVRRWIVLALIGVVLVLVMREILNPYDDRGYMAVPHGDHTHYVPRDWDRTVPMSNFPVVYPAPNERILADGRVVRDDR